MIEYTQHIPSFVDGVQPERGTVATTEELLALPWVGKWTFMRKGKFERWSYAPYLTGTARGLLIAEYDDGWWVVAHTSGDPPELPSWQMPRKK